MLNTNVLEDEDVAAHIDPRLIPLNNNVDYCLNPNPFITFS